MPILHESKEYIYNALTNDKGPIYKWDPIQKLYKYSNTFNLNKNYSKTFDPKSFMKRGDVIHFGNDDYRNNNKMIFDGEKLQHLDTNVDDYGGLPSNFVVGDNEDDFNIGDFEDIIDHNEINWLSKDKLKEIKIYESNGEIFGNVTIKENIWKINFEINEDTEFNLGYTRRYSRQYKCLLDNNNIIINTNPITKYLLKTIENQDNSKLVDLIKCNNKVFIISNYGKNYSWFIFQVLKEYKFIESDKNISTFPIIWKKRESSCYDCDTLILDKDHLDRYMKNDKAIDKVYINEIIGYPIKIELVKKEDCNLLMNYIKEYINKLVINYDNIKKRHPFYRDGSLSLGMFLEPSF